MIHSLYDWLALHPDLNDGSARLIQSGVFTGEALGLKRAALSLPKFEGGWLSAEFGERSLQQADSGPCNGLWHDPKS